MPSERTIFLDIDGVLNCKRTSNPRKFPYVVDPHLLERFLRLVDQTGADAVLSSTWRYDPAGLFSAKQGIPFIDVIPDFPQKPRHDEILAWLKTHGDVRRFAVLGDEEDQPDILPLFQPSAATGISEKNCRASGGVLLDKTDKDMRCHRTERFWQNIRSMIRGHNG